MVDRISARAMCLPFEQPQFAQQLRMIWQPHLTTREQRHAFQINVALGQRAFAIANTSLAPGAGDPRARIGVADNLANAIFFAQRRVLPRHFMRIEFTDGAAHQIGDAEIIFLVSNAESVRVLANTARCVNMSPVHDARLWWLAHQGSAP